MERDVIYGPENPMYRRLSAWHSLGHRAVSALRYFAQDAYKWIDTYLRHGPAGLEERSRRPHLPFFDMMIAEERI